MTIDEILSRLKKVTTSPCGEFKALCPAHDDRRQSLSITEKDSKILLHCHAGCKIEDICAAVKLTTKDLFADRGHKQERSEIVTTYDYTSADGKLLYQVCRATGKRFFQRRPDSKGGWVNNLRDTKLVLYRLPELLEALKKNELIFIVEGEKDAENLTKIGLIGTTNSGGATKWRIEYNEPLQGANVVILPDNDPPGKSHAEQVAMNLHGKAASVKVLELPNLPEKGDVSDWLAAGGTKDELLRLVAAAPEWVPVAEKPKNPQEREPVHQNNMRPGILITNRFMREITDDALRSLVDANNPPEFYKTGSEIVRIGQGDVVEPVTVAGLKGRMDRVADYVKFNKDGDEVPARPPEDVARDIMSLPAREIPFPELRGVRHAPVFLPDGKLLFAEGYDTDSGWLLRLRGLTGVRDDMSPTEARHWLDELLADFPFVDESSRAHTVALMLQPFIRELITGPVPCFLIDAPARGTGKGLLADTVVIVATGGTAPIMSLVGDGDEIEKRITALLLGGHSHILMDNVRVLRSQHLEAALTSAIWNGRRLGKSEMLYLPNRATWIATGNNVEQSDEMARRIIPIRLDAGVERPEDRSNFKHELPGWAYKNRAALVSACLSIVKNWIAAEQPCGTANLGRYESWAGVMSGLLDIAGLPGFLQNRARLQGQADTETQEWTATARLWWDTYSDRPITAGDLFEIVKEHSLLLSVWGGRSKTGSLQRMGHVLSKKRDRVFGRYVIRAAGMDGVTRNAAYRLDICAASAGGASKTPETPETPGDNVKSQARQGFMNTDAFGCFASEASKTPGKTTENTRGASVVLHDDAKNTRQNNWQKTIGNTSFLGVSGVSGVLNSPHSPGETQEREPGEDDHKNEEAF